MQIPNMIGTINVVDVIGEHDGHGAICELHPERAFPHDECRGPGMPLAQRISSLAGQRDAALRRADALEYALRNWQNYNLTLEERQNIAIKALALDTTFD